MLWVGFTCVQFWVDCKQSHLPHSLLDGLAVDVVVLRLQENRYSATAVKRRSLVLLSQ